MMHACMHAGESRDRYHHHSLRNDTLGQGHGAWMGTEGTEPKRIARRQARTHAPVHDVAGVEVLHGLEDVPHEVAREGLGVPPLVDDAVEEVPAPHQLHHQVQRVGALLVGLFFWGWGR